MVCVYSGFPIILSSFRAKEPKLIGGPFLGAMAHCLETSTWVFGLSDIGYISFTPAIHTVIHYVALESLL